LSGLTALPVLILTLSNEKLVIMVSLDKYALVCMWPSTFDLRTRLFTFIFIRYRSKINCAQGKREGKTETL